MLSLQKIEPCKIDPWILQWLNSLSDLIISKSALYNIYPSRANILALTFCISVQDHVLKQTKEKCVNKFPAASHVSYIMLLNRSWAS